MLLPQTFSFARLSSGVRRRLFSSVFVSTLVLSGLALAGAFTFVASAQAPQGQAPQGQAAQEPQLGGGKPIMPQPQGPIVFQQSCSSCHTAEGMNMGGRVIPSTATLRTLSPDQIYAALTTGSMVQQAAKLTDPQKRDVALFASGKRAFSDTSSYAVEKMANRCTTNPALDDLAATPSWNGWSPTPANARFQPAAAAGISAADVPKLKVKWAFGLPGGASGTSQPTVALGRVFVGSDNGYLYSLDAKTGCGYWSFKPQNGSAAGAYAPMIGAIAGQEGVKYAVYIVARSTAYAIDAQTGKELWQTPITGGGGMRGAATLAGGRIYQGITGSETFGGGSPTCCRTRGAVVSIDANTGKVIWRADTIQEPLRQMGTRKDGTAVTGPSGASVWNAPTVDLKRNRVYVGTGNSFGPIAASTSDSVVAFDIETGKIVWHHQEFKDDAFMLGCPDKNTEGGNCPPTLGPDWDFGGSSVIMQTLPSGQDILLAAGKGGNAIALDANDGKLLWRQKLYETTPPTADGLVLFGGTSDGRRVYYGLQQPKGGMAALELTNGKIDWNVEFDADGRGQFGAVSGIPGVVFTGAWDGTLRAVDGNGKVIWSHNSRQSYKTVNGVGADGGSFGSAGPTIAGGMMYAVSGYVGMQAGSAGNVLLAFGVE